MPEQNPAVMDFLLTRRSRPAKTLSLPVPAREELRPILEAAGRSPDHGKLEPWRFIVLERRALERLADLVAQRAQSLGLEQEAAEKAQRQFSNAHLAVAVLSVPREAEKVPPVEQHMSAGAVCLAMLNAALASGWGANWLTGWMARDEVVLREGLGASDGEFVAGFIHIGTETSAPPERPRPDIDAITEWMSE